MTPRSQLRSQAPDVYRAMAAFDRSIGEAGIDARLRELVKVRASQINGCAFCLHMHVPAARKLGETEDRLDTLAGWRESPFFDDRERAALALTDAVTLIAGEGVPDDVYDEAARHFSERELAALIWAIIAINSWNRIAIATRAVAGT
jgi:AhpD family alkylhydroperoxidase